MKKVSDDSGRLAALYPSQLKQAKTLHKAGDHEQAMRVLQAAHGLAMEARHFQAMREAGELLAKLTIQRDRARGSDKPGGRGAKATTTDPWQQLLETHTHWSDEQRAGPNHLARAGLFNARRSGERETYTNLLVGSTKRPHMLYTGPELRVDEQDALIELYHHHRRYPAHAVLTHRRSDLLHGLGWPLTGTYYRRLDASIKRLKAAQITLVDPGSPGRSAGAASEATGGNKAVGYEHLINMLVIDDRGNYSTQLGPATAEVWGLEGYSVWLREQRAELKSNIARWLQLYYVSHKDPYPIFVETLRQLMGLAELRERDLIKALGALVDVGLLSTYVIIDGKVTVTRFKRTANIFRLTPPPI